ncbi:MAG: hypothetical protein MJY88_01040 [Bacteroidales bacterium]|nr:hypothetical protein [Bacteroidales bacterium]
MVTFIGKATAKVDDKGRMVFPSLFKAAMPEDEPMTFVIHKDIYSDCLEMYTLAEWQRQSEAVKAKLDLLNEKHAGFWRRYMYDRAMVTPDPKLGRISIPAELLEKIGVTKEVVFLGGDYKIEIWAKDRFESQIISEEEYRSMAEELSQLR